MGNKNALNREVGEDGLRDWSYGLFDCRSTGRLCNQTYLTGPSLLCALTRILLFFLLLLQVAGPRFVLAWYTARTGSVYAICTGRALLSRVEVKDQVTTVGHIVAWPYLASIGSFRYVVNGGLARCPLNLTIYPGAQMGSRSDVRNRYDIRGDSKGDCLVSLCCRSCALTQESREIELEEKSFS
jgi:Cys-rich protein (TIGR01571 family)